MADHKVELEKKRKKLEELRKAREQKKKEAVDKEVCAGEREEGSKSRSDCYMEAALIHPAICSFLSTVESFATEINIFSLQNFR